MILIFLSPLYCTCPQNGQEISRSLGTLIAIHNIVSLFDIFKEEWGDHDEMDGNSFIGIAIYLWFFIRCNP